MGFEDGAVAPTQSQSLHIFSSDADLFCRQFSELITREGKASFMKECYYGEESLTTPLQ